MINRLEMKDSLPQVNIDGQHSLPPVTMRKSGDFFDKTDGPSTKRELLDMIEERTKEKREKLVEKFVSALTLHGYSQFHEASGVRKVLWGLILITFTVVIFRLTYLSYRTENCYKQVLEFEIEKVKEISFPTVTICSFLPVYTQAIRERFPVKNLSEEQFKQFYYSVFSNRAITRNERDQDSSYTEFDTKLLNKLYEKGFRSYKEILGLFEKHEESDIHSDIVKKIMAHHECTFSSKSCDFTKDFRTVYRQKTQSLCQQFNFYEKQKPGLLSTGNDRENSFFMYWDISGENYHYDDGLSGLLVEIHPYGTPHHLVDNRKSVYLEPGVLTDVAIEEVTTRMLPYPFKPNCREEERKVAKDYPYSKATCELECFLQEALDKCGCAPDQFAEYAGNIKVCNISEMKCVFQASKDRHCDDCPDECNAIDYKISTSRLGFGSNWISRIIKDIPGWENRSKEESMTYINQNIVGFRIGFKTLEKHIQAYKEAVPWYERLSMLGGTMGLLLGFSVITGFEFLFFLFDYLYICIKYKCTYDYLSAVLDQGPVKATLQKKWSTAKKGHDIERQGQ